ncbi:MAG TPA: ribbon-helix-helix protein, CopG family [Candidatus Acidoferrales bacterium]|nr:ribbon-helix-helix protein, CopG family [Candidatus Acidoferrales bacterium]
MRRTQLYLDDDLWNALHAHARRQGTTISDLVRQTVRERYLGNLEERRAAMLAFVGIRKDRKDLPDSTEEYVRSLRRDTRLERLWKR